MKNHSAVVKMIMTRYLSRDHYERLYLFCSVQNC